MPRFIYKNKKEIGVSPYDLVYRGSEKLAPVSIELIDFDSEQLEEVPVTEVATLSPYLNKRSVTWVNVDGIHESPIMEGLASTINLDKMVLADVMNTQSRPKALEHDNCLYISIKMLQVEEGTERIQVENLSLIISSSVLLSFQERPGDVFEPVRDRLRRQKRKIRSSGPDYLTFALLDIVIDNYLYILSELGERIERLEDRMLNQPEKTILYRINAYKRELNFIRRNIKPAKEMVLNLTKLDSDFIEEHNEVHYKELLDNINLAIETSDSYREILSDQLNIYHTTVSSKLNDVMKFLTIFSVVFIPLTFIAGIYGTNFEYVPELSYKYSYHIMWAVMIIIAALMMLYFKRKKWF